jgi:predicted ATPase with chaperone activity
MEYPDLCTKQGGWDTNKVSKYLENINEPLLDRLDIFDLVYDRNTLDLYESLTDALQDYVIETDVMEGFKAARKLIVLLDEQRNIEKVM